MSSSSFSVATHQALGSPVYRRNVLWLYPLANVMTVVVFQQSVIRTSLVAVALLLQVLHLASHLRTLDLNEAIEAVLAVGGVLVAAAITYLGAFVFAVALITIGAATGSLDWS